MKKLLLIVNPNAGRAGYRDCLSDVLYTIDRGGCRPTVVFSRASGDIRRLAAEDGPAYDRVVCMGGDGTLSEAVTGLMGLAPGDRPELGYIPMGTSNDCATNLGLSRDPVYAAYTAACGSPLPLDVGRFNGTEYFTYVAAFGAFTEVSYETPQDQKNSLGWLAYALDALNRVPNLTHRICRIEYDGGVLEDDYIFCAVANATRFGGGIFHLSSSHGVSLSDGLFEVMLIRTPETILELGPTISDALSNNFTGEFVSLLHTKNVRFTFHDPVSWTRDGEDGGKHREVVCENLPHAIRVMVRDDFAQGV